MATVTAVFADYRPVADWALIEFGVRDVGSETPLVGPFSRYGWNHPGPLLFWVLAVPYRLGGAASEALLVGAGLINLASVVAACALAWRRGGWPLLLLVSAGLAVLLRSVGPGYLMDPWNPYVTMLPFLVLVLLVWSVLCGEHLSAPVVVAVGAFLVQTHVGYAPIVGVLLVGVLVGLWLVRSGRIDDAGPRLRGRAPGPVASLVAAAVVGALLSVSVVVEQVTREPGNVGQIVEHFASDDRAALGVGPTLPIVGQHAELPGGIWITGEEPLDPFVGSLEGGTGWWILPALVAFGAGVVAAWSRRDAEVLWLQAVVGVTAVVGFVAITRTTGEVFPYLFQWMRPLTMLWWLTAAWAVYRAAPEGPRRPSAARVGTPVLVAIVVVLSLVTSLSDTELLIEDGFVDDAVAATAPPTVDAIEEAGADPVLVWPVGDCIDWTTNGIGLALERAGIGVRVPPEEAYRYGGDHRAWDGLNAEQMVVVACRDDLDTYAGEPGFTEVARYSALTPEEEREYEEVEAALIEDGARAGRGGVDRLDRETARSPSSIGPMSTSTTTSSTATRSCARAGTHAWRSTSAHPSPWPSRTSDRPAPDERSLLG
ncbi:MAG: hypothetical protein U5R31_05535 [Acidimicrobiia bacterium]|nr:hypothetical protein [Acidimicrobiia bacterium]